MGDQCKRVKQQMPKTTQVVLFSATFPQEVLDFANLFAPKSNQITLEVEKLTVKGIKQMVSIDFIAATKLLHPLTVPAVPRLRFR
jgi:superfamily II DNA/RNA helicase